ncbi:MAG: hypothetical protein IJI66_14565 [Erysipelotrichaceae bacterium]|nr:hypothetical protein [Erysipelotrichaceae bacterium]
MPIQFINKARYFRIGQSAPKNSCFKGTVTPQSIFGGAGSYFDYTERYAGKQADSMMDYTGRYGYTVSSEGNLDTREKIEAFKEKGIEALSKDGAICYEFVLSMKDYDTASNYNIVNQEQFSSVIKTIMPSYLKSIGLDPGNVSWWEDFHPENRTSTIPHPHVHILFFENEPSGSFDRTYGKLPKKSLDDFKRMFANQLLKREYSGRYTELFRDINVSRRDILDKTKHTDLSKVKSVKDLYAVLPSSGRLQINSVNMIPYREAVLNVVDSLLKSKECRDEWDNYLTALDRYESEINAKAGGNVSSRKDTEIVKIKEQIANTVLSGRKGYEKENSYEKILENTNHKESEGNKGRIYKDTDIVRSRLSGRNSSLPVKRVINGLLAQRQREIENEIEQYLNQGKDYSMSL